jgi:hypothetical protein
MSPQTIATHKMKRSVGRRAELLADHIEEGAAGLAAFVEGLSESEWRTPVSGSDRRPVGVIVHHVASVYPIEIDLARAIVSGKAVTDVTWKVVAELNGKHAQENAEVTKAAAVEILRRNSPEAAAVVRAFRDDELDQTGPLVRRRRQARRLRSLLADVHRSTFGAIPELLSRKGAAPATQDLPSQTESGAPATQGPES